MSRIDISSTHARSILTPASGFLAAQPYPFTHSLSPYTGCAFGTTTCGTFCYAQFQPNWVYANNGAGWGQRVVVKENAAELLEVALAKLGTRRRELRILMSSTTDPYQPLEAAETLTQRCLEVFARYDDLDLLLVQTRSPLVHRDLDLIAGIPYAWLSMTVESDDSAVYRRLRGGPSPADRLAVVRAAVDIGIKAQVAVSPCLPYTPDFAVTLAESGATRVVVDTFVEGDGQRGRRTAQSPYARLVPAEEWRDPSPARRLYEGLKALGMEVGWSASGFAGIPPRHTGSDRPTALPLLW